MALILLMLALSGCGGGGGGASAPPVTVPTPGGGNGGGDGGGDGSGDGGTETLAHCTPSAGTFSNVTNALGLCYEVTLDEDPTELAEIAGGLALADVNGDGGLELLVAYGQGQTSTLFSFDGTRFVEWTDSGFEPSAVDFAGYFVDVNGDGWKDLVCNQETGVEIFLSTDGTGFEPAGDAVSIEHERATFSLAAGDFDVDGDLDLFFTHWGTRRIDVQQEYLWRNNGNGVYADVSFRVPVEVTISGNGLESEYTFTPIFADFDSDGTPDLLLASDFESSQILLNFNKGDSFIDRTTTAIDDENGMGAAVTDYDRDGDLDWFVTSIWDPELENNGSGNRLYQNADGLGTFINVTEEAGVAAGDWGWGACFADFDNDGFMDIFHTNGHQDQGGPQFRNDPSVLFMSNGDGTFTERAGELGVNHTDQGRGVVCADYDGDGRVDIFIANNGKSPTVFRNEHQNGHHYVAVDLTGLTGNPEAIGARVAVTTASGTQTQEVQLGNGYLSHGPATLHFGLGDDDIITAIDVTWPGPDTVTSRLQSAGIDQRITIVHPLAD